MEEREEGGSRRNRGEVFAGIAMLFGMMISARIVLKK